MARTRDRIFAGLGALLFFGSACALTVAVIWQANQNSGATNQTANSPTSTCTITSVASTTEKTPAVFKPTGKVAKLVSTDLTTGTGAAVKAGDCLTVKYFGTLATTGKVFDENFDKATALKFELGKSQVIAGWDQGVVGMKVGGVRRLVIPADLAYGSSEQNGIPANSTLVFVVKLLSVGQ